MNDAPGPPPIRKIIHVDMDAFFAAVEQRDDPSLRGRPVAVGGLHRGVVAAASYEARPYGVRSAMPSATARRLCPDLVFVKSRFDVYRAVSNQIRAIFRDYTPLVEPLSLDEAYLDVTRCRMLPTATAVAKEIRARIREATGLTASAGVSYNTFLAKLASDQNKPDGLCVITPAKGPDFVAALPVARFHGVGPKTAAKMARLGIATGADLRAKSRAWLAARFGPAAADHYHDLARAICRREVRPDRIRKSIGAEDTFAEDLSAEADLLAELGRIGDRVWARIAEKGEAIAGRTVTLKVKYRDFSIVTRARTLDRPVAGRDEFVGLGAGLLRGLLPPRLPIRLLGLTLSKLGEAGDERPAELALPF